MARLARTLGAVGLLVLLAGGQPLAADALPEQYIAGHFVAASPRPERRSPAEAAQLAQRIAAAHPGAFVTRGQGNSMQPLYPDGTLLVVQPRPYDQLQRGMTVLFRHEANRRIAHVLVAKAADGWRTAGLNNRRADYVRVDAANIAGVVIAAFTEADGRRFRRP